MIGRTETELPSFTNLGGDDNFLIVVSNNFTLQYLQWGTEYPDDPSHIVIDSKRSFAYIAGVSHSLIPQHFVSIIGFLFPEGISLS